MKELILGGARSGKSRHAEQRARLSGLDVAYVATAVAGDAEMAARIGGHRARRPPSWPTVEEPLALAASLEANAGPGRFILVDCLTLWLSNLLAEGEEVFRRERQALLQVLPGLPGRICLVSNEVGQGIVPLNPLARRFVDEAGWLHQELAVLCDRVVWVVAGLPQVLKGAP
ncbi:bifunctional adenosylcobinamide kinase/adenosylcobinamide-phosphate guanylyltransferase [Methylococcus capsulatus]|nr:bifunctional adenosylcobinamide kinase/adenosylcobinamide-phosphate guanylyltransferase [Methylococcus capsulatus]QXP88721.1 bifunctional adenosylcobinamide kinase/adenosylcobinamide-phosphate guanylyltransferase [Methylococcus capsulatus]QXP94248.1 bifunctional adenosylcobinamide kinase/adenosylcobinamide-phosphate guanylyltransferase [Methylococcus capsulatus]UQN11000.1 bifunctional adenosylcobinamide kinase/adenosylcobinamide-phosphate guanylyltransferase [Methylococcus capsulatus]